MHFFFYGLAMVLYTAAVFLAGMYIGEKIERAWKARSKESSRAHFNAAAGSRSGLRTRQP
jgi:hypothetical protein